MLKMHYAKFEVPFASINESWLTSRRECQFAYLVIKIFIVLEIQLRVEFVCLGSHLDMDSDITLLIS